MSNSYDQEWFSRLLELSTQTDEATWFQRHAVGHFEEQSLFLDNDVENPRFAYTTALDLEPKAAALKAFTEEVGSSDSHAVVIDLYERKLKKQLLRCQLIQASQAGDDQWFYEVSSKLYGKPQKKYFAYVAERVRQLCDDRAGQEPQSAQRLRKVLSKIVPDHEITVDILPPEVTGKALTSISEVEQIFQETLDRLEITGWRLEVDSTNTRTRFSVNPFRQIVYIPGQEKLFARAKQVTDVHIKGLAEHEVGVHARRAFEAQKTRLNLLQIGLDSYLVGEEGLAGYVQQQIEGASEFYGFDRYFASCLAVGMDGTKRDFRAVFGLMVDYYTLKFAGESAYTGQPIEAAWEVCIRIFRGTTGTGVGTIYTKDIVYMEGNIAMWEFMTDHPDRFEMLFIGKFNPFITRHIKSLQTLEILEQW